MTFARSENGSSRTSRLMLAALLGAASSRQRQARIPRSALRTERHDDATSQHWAVIEKYRFECHNTTDWAGGIAFDSMTLDTLDGDAEVWEKSIRRMRGRLMPPPGKPQPEQAQITSLVCPISRLRWTPPPARTRTSAASACIA